MCRAGDALDPRYGVSFLIDTLSLSLAPCTFSCRGCPARRERERCTANEDKHSKVSDTVKGARGPYLNPTKTLNRTGKMYRE